jgi:hypothetical protein
MNEVNLWPFKQSCKVKYTKWPVIMEVVRLS